MRLKNGDVCLHKKTGNKYRIIVVANKNSGQEGFPKMVVYISMNDGEVYVRPYSEFVEKFVNLSKSKTKAKPNVVSVEKEEYLRKLKSESQSLCAKRKNAIFAGVHTSEIKLIAKRIKAVGKTMLEIKGNKWSI